MPDNPVLLLDVDGVLNAVSSSDPLTWPTWRVTRTNGFSIRWSPDMITALVRLGERVELRWLTTWWNDVERLEFLGLPGMPVACTREEYLDAGGGPLSWWKLTTARRVYDEGRGMVWVDDDLAHDRHAQEWVASLPAREVLGVSPDPRVGLNPQHVIGINRWLDDREK